MTQGDGIEARLVALELLFRGMLTGLVSKAFDPVGEISRMEEEFRSTAGCLRIGAGDEHAEHMRELVVLFVDSNFEAIRNRILGNLEIEAAWAGRKN